MSRIVRTVLAALPLVFALGCDGRLVSNSAPAETSAASVSNQSAPDDPSLVPTSEGERTRAMQEKQAEMNRKMEEARAGNLTPEELQRVYQEVEQDRQELNRMGEGAPPPVETGGAADYPPPPR